VRRISGLLLVDAICFVFARGITRWISESSVTQGALVGPDQAQNAASSEAGLALALLVGTAISGTYGAGDARRHVGRLFLAAALASALPLWGQVWQQAPAEAFENVMVVFGPLFLALVTLRTAFDAALRRWSHGTGSHTLARAVLVGTAGDCLARRDGASLTCRAGFDVLGFVDIAPRSDHRSLGSVTDVERILLERDADTVVLCGLPAPATTNRVLRAAAVAECTVLVAAPQLELPAVRPNVIKQDGQPLLELRPVVLRAEQLLVKRAVDIVGSLFLLVLLAPVLAVIAVLVALDSPGPVVFSQRRLGRFGRPIRCYKFRSMFVDAEARLFADPALFRRYVEHDYKLPASIDTRITRVGRFLRRMSLDELPQLWNVLKGEMSLVGPRPIVPDEIHHYNGEGPLLLSLKPGITGQWQVSGRSAVAYPARAAVELEYVEGWSLWRDLGIMLRTLPAVLAARGAH
jgi:exopolysaccharide biosynthesis polyprenyl glycosylphosphotransferase